MQLLNDCCPISGETVQEERLNYWTHLSGLILSFFGWIALCIYSMQITDSWHFWGYMFYGAALVLLYAASTFYHGSSHLGYKLLFRIFDHICIYLLIVGTFAPFALGPLRELGGPELLGLEISFVLIGILSKIVAIDRFQKLSLMMYLALGWLGAYSFPALMQVLPSSILFWIVLGGLFYTSGTIFFAVKRIPFNHAIWHLFVMSGSACHYYAVFNMLQQSI